MYNQTLLSKSKICTIKRGSFGFQTLLKSTTGHRSLLLPQTKICWGFLKTAKKFLLQDLTHFVISNIHYYCTVCSTVIQIKIEPKFTAHASRLPHIIIRVFVRQVTSILQSTATLIRPVDITFRKFKLGLHDQYVNIFIKTSLSAFMPNLIFNLTDDQAKRENGFINPDIHSYRQCHLQNILKIFKYCIF